MLMLVAKWVTKINPKGQSTFTLNVTALLPCLQDEL